MINSKILVTADDPQNSRKIRAARIEKRSHQFLQWSVLGQQEAPQRHWFVDQWLTSGATLFSGSGGSGKSRVAQAIASSLATRTAYLTEPQQRELVSLAWYCEDENEEIWRRQVPICSTLSIEMCALEDLFYAESRLGCENTLYAPAMGRMVWTPAFDLLKEQVNDVGADVLWLDNIGHTFAGNENERFPVTSFVNGLVGMRPGKPFAVVLLGHVARGKDSEFAGSAAWENAVRTRWYLGDRLPDQEHDDDVEPDADVRYLCRRKANYSFADYRKLTYRNGVFIPEEQSLPNFGDRYGGGAVRRQEDAESIVLDGFDRCVAAGIAATDGRTSPDYLPTRILAMSLAGGKSKKELVTAMNRLMADGRLKRVQVGTYSNRTPKFGLGRPAQASPAQSAHCSHSPPLQGEERV